MRSPRYVNQARLAAAAGSFQSAWGDSIIRDEKKREGAIINKTAKKRKGTQWEEI
jgi:hypothetical protein